MHGGGGGTEEGMMLLGRKVCLGAEIHLRKGDEPNDNLSTSRKVQESDFGLFFLKWFNLVV